MIFYFTSTGNCKYVAQCISNTTGDQIVPISVCVKKNHSYFRLEAGERLGFVLPTYFGTYPSILTDFLEQVQFTMGGDNYVYVVDTYGFHPGNVCQQMKKLLQSTIGRAQDGSFTIQMVDNWVPNFDLTDRGYVSGAEEKAEELIAQVVEQIAACQPAQVAREWPAPVMAIMKAAYRRFSSTKGFAVADQCVGCGLCQRQCPVSAIEMQDRKPFWVKDRCVLCLGCLHRCPVNAISYGRSTKDHGQYFNPHTTPDIQ